MAKLIQKWVTFDGVEHSTAEAADAHEAEQFQGLLVGLTREDVEDAIARKPEALAISEAIEKAGTLIARARRDAGELKRKPAAKPEQPSSAPQGGEEHAERGEAA